MLGFSKSSSRRRQSVSLHRRQKSSRQRSSRAVRGREFLSQLQSLLSSFWLWGVVIFAIMLVWNWQLLLATVIAMGMLIVLFRFPVNRWSGYWRKWQQTLDESQQRLLMALGGSSLIGVGSYWALQLWDHLDNHWLAGSAIAQGILLTGLFGLQVSKLITASDDNHPQHHFSQLIDELSAEHPLKRLRAIRQLTQLAIKDNLHASQLQEISESFSLLFAVETEPILRQGLLESMQTLQRHQCWQKWEIKSGKPLQKLQKVKKVPEHIQQSN
ncbi:ABC transporter ATP-binding protein [Halothece sp. PCC 7418]|uniref:ABC transporter ATP-binding protein n=1 Tax=Halothece sp. (strain PCC 7418) TaxID=65093 RepID=UPI001C0A8660|nr:ABC transporter ATP-binding protein [Halothece sp. PCC 7418]